MKENNINYSNDVNSDINSNDNRSIGNGEPSQNRSNDTQPSDAGNHDYQSYDAEDSSMSKAPKQTPNTTPDNRRKGGRAHAGSDDIRFAQLKENDDRIKRNLLNSARDLGYISSSVQIDKLSSKQLDQLILDIANTNDAFKVHVHDDGDTDNSLNESVLHFYGPRLNDDVAVAMSSEDLAKHKLNIPVQSDLKKYDVTRKIRKSIARGVNPFLEEFPRLESYLDYLKADGQASLRVRYEELKRQITGKTPINGIFRKLEDVNVTGRYHLSLLLTQMMYKLANAPAMIPLGDLRHISVANRSTFIAMADMLLRRLSMMGSLTSDQSLRDDKFMQNYLDRADANSVLDNLFKTKRDYNSEDDNNQTPGESNEGGNIKSMRSRKWGWPSPDDYAFTGSVLRSLQSRLSQIYERSKDRQMMMSYVMPLLRSVLVDRGEIKNVVPTDISLIALEYAEWMRRYNGKWMKQVLFDIVSTSVRQHEWMKSLITLKELCVQGTHTTVTQAMDMLGRLQDSWHQEVSQYWGTTLLRNPDGQIIDANPHQTGSEVEVELVKSAQSAATNTRYDHAAMISPVGVIQRSVELRNIHDDIIGICDKFSSAYTDLNRITTKDIIALIKMLVLLDEREQIQSLSLSFITDRPEWSGLIDLKHVALTKEESEFISSLEPLFVQKFMSKLLSDYFVSTPLSSLFDVPNYNEIMKDFNDHVQMSGLCHDAVRSVITELINVIASSYEWYNNPIWAELASAGFMQTMTVDSQSFGLKPYVWRELIRKSALVSYQQDDVTLTKYFVESSAPVPVAIPKSVIEFLRSADALGIKKTHFTYYRPYMTSATATVDVLRLMKRGSQSGMDEMTVHNLIKQGQLIRLSDIDPRNPMFNRPFTVETVDTRRVIHDGSEDSLAYMSNSMIVLAEAAPYMKVVFPNLTFDDQHPVMVLGNALTNPVIEGGAGVNPDQPIITNGHVLPFDGIRTYDVIDPSTYILIQRDVDSVDIFNPRVKIPRDQASLMMMVKSHSYSLLAELGPEFTIPNLENQPNKPDGDHETDDDSDGKPTA